jgi:F-type H+-transporting ATPase subunit b
MANATENKPSSGMTVVSIVFGLILMVGGMYVAKMDDVIKFQKGLAEQGIPLEPGKTVASIGVFLILFKVIESFFIVPLRDAINARNGELEATFSEVESLRSEMNTMKSDYEKRIVETEADARDKIQSQIKEAQDLRSTLVAEANAAKDSMMAKAQEELAAEKEKIMNSLRVEVVNMTLAATEKLVGKSVDSDTNRKLVADFIEKAEVPSR